MNDQKSSKKLVFDFFGTAKKEQALDAFFKKWKKILDKQTQSAEELGKCVSKALAAFDEVNRLKMPSSSAAVTQKEETSQPDAWAKVMDALSAMASKTAAFANLLKILTRLPGVLADVIAPGNRTIGIFEKIAGVFAQTERSGEAVRRKTEAIAVSAAGLASAWNRATSSLAGWKQMTQAMGETTRLSAGIQTLAQYAQSLTGAFQRCARVSETTVGGIERNWQGLSLWFRNSVADPIIRDVNALLEGVTTGFNQVLSQGGYGVTPLSAPTVPHLAQGAVLPANKPFLAVVGDQRNGTNVEAPLETIKQAVAEVVGNRDVVIQFNGDLAQLARVLRPAIAKESARVGGGLITREVV